MQRVFSVSMIRAREAAAVKTAGLDELMKVAARGVAGAVQDVYQAGEVAALVGGGDNGGDALYAAAFLCREGVPVKAVVLSDHPHERALTAARAAGVEICQPAKTAADVLPLLASATVWIDGLVGTGTEGALKEPLASIVAALEEARGQLPGRKVVAVDVPSGLATPDGTVPADALRADIVVTMGALKPSAVFPPTCYYQREVRLVDLGLDLGPHFARVLEGVDVREVVALPSATDHKYSRGVVRLVVGSQKYPGAAVLATLGARGVGTGMIRLVTDEATRTLVLTAAPEVVTVDGRAQAVAVGCGMDPQNLEDRSRIATQIFEAEVPLVVDAGAISVAAQLVHSGHAAAQQMVWTPHAGEAAAALSILDESEWTRERVEEAPIKAAMRLAGLSGAVIALKGAATLIVSPRGHVFVQAQAPAWAGTAGSGDVLAGAIAGVLAGVQARVEEEAGRLDWEELTRAVAAAVWLHGVAARRAAGFEDVDGQAGGVALRPGYGLEGGRPIAASDIARNLPDAFGQALRSHKNSAREAL